jgi:DUF4097 and DUF4098 domain-containing protein YvlB
MKRTLVLAALILTGLGSLAAFETTKSLELSAQDIKRLEIQAGAGSLTATGREGLAAIEVKAEIVARHVRDEDMAGFLKDRIELTLEKRGDVAVLVGRVRDRFRLFGFDDAVINLTVLVPKAMPLEIDDGSGSLAVADLAAVTIEDGSGSIRIDRIAGEVRIDDGSGGIEINDVGGDVTVDDGSGEIIIRRIGGTVTVDDGSGSIDIEGVEKDVRLINTGSGGVDVSSVKGRVVRSR